MYKEVRDSDGTKEEFLFRASQVPGIYVPSLYDVSYNEDGTIAEFKPNKTGVPEKVKKQVVTNLDDTYYPDKPLIPYIRATQDRVVLEIQRGCIRGCRFCQAGITYRPVRKRSVEKLKDLAIKMLESTGYEEMTLSSLSSSDYEQLGELVTFLIEQGEKYHCNIALPSLRIDEFSLDVMSKVQDVKKSSLTFAPEAGSQRMRNVINKNLTKDVILEGAITAFKGGWKRVKLYFMLGLPGEEDEDIRNIADLADEIAAAYFENIPKENVREDPRSRRALHFSFQKHSPRFNGCLWGRLTTLKKKGLC